MLRRKIYNQIEKFYKSNPNKALMITGARQVGKSTIVEEFANKHFKHFIKIDFIKNEEYVPALSGTKSTDEILLRLSSLFGDEMVPGETLIFFDEVQECKELITQIKYLVQEGSYTYILSGSLLGTVFQDILSVPVGYMDIYRMFPLDFEEFVYANGVNKKVIDAVRKSFENEKPVDSFLHERLMSLFELYLIVGGMPSAVKAYIETKNLRKVAEEQNAIIALYKHDISKYDKKNKLYLNEIFDLIPSELNAKNKRFILKNLNENAKFSKYNNSFLWLKSQYGNGIQLKILQHETTMNFGSIYENIAAQELLAHGHTLYYFNSKKLGELDFLIESEGNVIPIEIKSGKDYYRHSAMDNVLKHPEFDIPKGYVFCNGNVETDGKVVYFPIYMLMFLQKETLPDEIIFDTDFSDLNQLIDLA